MITAKDYEKFMKICFPAKETSRISNLSVLSPNDKIITDRTIKLADTIYNLPKDNEKWKEVCIKGFTTPLNDIIHEIGNEEVKSQMFTLLSVLGHNVLYFNNKPIEHMEDYINALVVANGMISSKNCPTQLKEHIFLLMKECFSYSTDTYYSQNLFRKIMNEKCLSKEFIDWLVSYKFKYISNEIMIQTSLAPFPQSTIKPSRDTLNKIAISIMENCTSEETISKTLFLNIDESVAFLVLAQLHYNENAVARFCSNPKFSANVRNDIFDKYEFNPDVINYTYITEHMANALCKQIWGTLFENEAKYGDKDLLDEIVFSCKRKLIRMIQEHTLPSSREIDLANRLVSPGFQDENDLLKKALITYTKNPCVLDIMTRTKGKIRNAVFINEKCPFAQSLNEINRKFKSGEKVIKTHSKLLSTQYPDDIYNITRNHQFSKDIYKKAFFMEVHSTYRNFERYLSLDKIPIETLKIFTEKEIEFNDKIYETELSERTYAKCLYDVRQNKMDKCVMIELYSDLQFLQTEISSIDKQIFKNIVCNLYNLIQNNKDFNEYIKIIDNAIISNSEDNEESKLFEMGRKTLHYILDNINVGKFKEYIKEREYEKIEYCARDNMGQIGDHLHFVIENSDIIQEILKFEEQKNKGKEEYTHEEIK